MSEIDKEILFLHVIAAETLAISIQRNSKIKGITIDRNKTKLLQYADDTTVVLSDTCISSAQILFRLLNDFEQISGLAVNPTKTEGTWIGSLRENKSTPFGIKWRNEPVKAVGVYYSFNQKLVHEKNFIERLDSVEKTHKFMVCKRSLAIWKGNFHKILDYPKVCLHSIIINHPQGGNPRIK